MNLKPNMNKNAFEHINTRSRLRLRARALRGSSGPPSARSGSAAAGHAAARGGTAPWPAAHLPEPKAEAVIPSHGRRVL